MVPNSILESGTQSSNLPAPPPSTIPQSPATTPNSSRMLRNRQPRPPSFKFELPAGRRQATCASPGEKALLLPPSPSVGRERGTRSPPRGCFPSQEKGSQRVGLGSAGGKVGEGSGEGRGSFWKESMRAGQVEERCHQKRKNNNNNNKRARDRPRKER